MTGKISLILAFASMVAVAAYSVPDGAETNSSPSPAPQPPPSATNLWFNVGETITYNIYWGYIYVGSSHVTTEWVVHDDGRTLLRIRFETHSNSFIEKIYPVSDLQEALIDPETFLPIYYRKDSRQGRRVENEIVYFDHAARKAHWESFVKNKKKEIDIDPDSRDLITFMYFLRSRPFDVGKTLTTRVYTDEKIYDLYIKFPEKEGVELDKYGKVTSVMCEPEAAFEGLFVRKGKMLMWVSDDDRRVCTKITAKIPVASIRILLDEVRGPGNDRWVGRSPKIENSPYDRPVRR